MVNKLLRNYYWESIIDNLIEKERINSRIKTKSQLLRKILKERYNLCLTDDCLAYSLSDGLCLVHKNQG